MNREEEIRRAVELSKKFADDGKLIEAGWASYRILVVPANAPQVQIDECRQAFMAGAQHLFGSIMGILDPGAEPTEADYDKMELIDKELRAFVTAELAKPNQPHEVEHGGELKIILRTIVDKKP